MKKKTFLDESVIRHDATLQNQTNRRSFVRSIDRKLALGKYYTGNTKSHEKYTINTD